MHEITNRSLHLESKLLKEDEKYLNFPDVPRVVVRNPERQSHFEKMMKLNLVRQNIVKMAKEQGSLISYFKSPKVRKDQLPDIAKLIVAAKQPTRILNSPPNHLSVVFKSRDKENNDSNFTSTLDQIPTKVHNTTGLVTPAEADGGMSKKMHATLNTQKSLKQVVMSYNSSFNKKQMEEALEDRDVYKYEMTYHGGKQCGTRKIGGMLGLGKKE